MSESGAGPGRTTALPALALAGIVLALFGRAVTFDFVALDDRYYLLANPWVRAGLTGRGVLWAFGPSSVQYHPLTWLTHMLDFELFGTAPGPRHAINVLLHAGSSALLFVFLARASRRVGASWAAALLFAVHPLRVESVAWIFERKDVLSVFLAMLTLLAWSRYVVTRKRSAYAAALTLFALALLAKPMLVTLPALLLLLDVWPFRRLEPTLAGLRASGWPLLREKLPFVPFAAASAALTVLASLDAATVWSLGSIPPGRRLSLAVDGAVWYLGKSLRPVGLACLYPIGAPPALPALLAATALLVALTALAFGLRRRCPAVLVGWLFYLVALAPVSGLVQAGWQSTADRYSYLPSVGLVIAAVFGVAALLEGLPARPRLLAGSLLAGAPALGFAALTSLQLPVWRDSLTLYRNAVLVSPSSWFVRYNLATVLAASGQLGEAELHLRFALRERPGWPAAVDTLARVLEQEGRSGEVPALLETARRDNPDSPELLAIAAAAYGRLGDSAAAARAEKDRRELEKRARRGPEPR